MRNWPAALLEHLRGEEATPAICWLVEKRDGTFIRATEHDQDVPIPAGSPTTDLAGIYHAVANITASDIVSSTDLAVDNLEVQGAIAPAGQIVADVNLADIEAGVLNRAPVTVFVVNWRDPSMGYGILRRGWLGEIHPNSDGGFQTEIRGLLQAFSQTIVQTYGERCDVVRLGDARCKVNVAAFTIVVTATAVVNRKVFTVSGITSEAVDWYSGGILRPLTGVNAGRGIEREVKADSQGGTQGVIALWDGLPDDPAPGDTFALEAACDRSATMCRVKFANLVNFRGKGLFIPGMAALMKGPT
jgi:uncharacterized phage protein (TIGR02218 family)